MRAILLTSTYLRHRYVIGVLAQALDLVGVWQEEKSFRPEQYAVDLGDNEIIGRHFASRDASEAEWFASSTKLGLAASAIQRTTTAGGVNDSSEVRIMEQLAPDVVAVFGTGLLRGRLLEAFAGRTINLHLGLSPYYRGAGTNFWPLVNREPEYVGATIHYLDDGIDTGPIISHTRPEIASGDGPHDIGNKAIVAGARALVQAVCAHAGAGPQPAAPQGKGGRLYQRKDFTAQAVTRLYRQFETGMIDEYLGDRARRDARVALVSLPARV